MTTTRGTGGGIEYWSPPPTTGFRFTAGDEAVFEHDQLRIRKQAQQASLGPSRDKALVADTLRTDWVIYGCVTDSACGLAVEWSDVGYPRCLRRAPEADVVASWRIGIFRARSDGERQPLVL
ncbi:MAG: hypothetical protein ACRD6W_04225 [Nitrososphaerales archaeon]